MKKRFEKDVLGHVEVPEDAYYGSFTARALHNFNISPFKFHHEMMKALAQIKWAAALTNKELKLLDKQKADAIIKSIQEIIQGKHNKEFTLDVFQAGAGTPLNMNLNEVIANRASEILHYKKGSYVVDPNNDVNLSQSSNDVIPTAIRVATITLTHHLIKELKHFQSSFIIKAKEYEDIIKTGRTHEMDAVPLTLGQEFLSYASNIERNICNILQSLQVMYEIPLGGTAVGTGINTHPQYETKVLKHLTKITHYKLRKASNKGALLQSTNDFLLLASALKILAADLIKIANDLMFLSSGPTTGINEITLPAVEPGSSIMPGKVNPSILEALNMVCFQVIGNEQIILLATTSGHLELNVYTPLIAFNLHSSLEILTNALHMATEKCIKGIQANKEQCHTNFEKNPMVATILNPYLGYKVTAYLVHESIKRKIPLHELLEELKLMEYRDINKVFSLKNLVSPSPIDKQLLQKIKTNKHYLSLLKKV